MIGARSICTVLFLVVKKVIYMYKMVSLELDKNDINFVSFSKKIGGTKLGINLFCFIKQNVHAIKLFT